jgi:hypothetical protein
MRKNIDNRPSHNKKARFTSESALRKRIRNELNETRLKIELTRVEPAEK